MHAPAILSLLLLAVQGASTAPAPTPRTSDILTRSLEAYRNAKTYQARWTYTLSLGEAKQTAAVEVKAKGPTRLLFSVSAASGRPIPGAEPIPEMRVVLDGAHAWFWSGAENVFFRVALPPNAAASPLMFFPQMPTTGEARRLPDEKVGDRTVIVLQGARMDGGVSRMEIDAETYRVRRIVVETPMGAAKQVSSLTIDRETLDADIPDGVFVYRPPARAREVPAPPTTAALFGTPPR
ncbi:MAG TPA: hypothetical protein VLH79_12545 [Chthonomonadales bacterium]|nr:hypothetical protein [Chthonomonadales bacterium]